MAMAAYNPRRAIAIEHGEVKGDALEALCHIFPLEVVRERREEERHGAGPYAVPEVRTQSCEKYEMAALPENLTSKRPVLDVKSA